jgi:predicted metal-dependent peptidase
LYEVIKKLIKIKIPWNEILEDCIKIYSQVDLGDRTWKNPNKYFIPLNIILPGNSNYDLKPKILVITVDTSGSISNEDLKKFSYVIYKNFNHFTKIILITHDIKIHNIEEFTESLVFLEYIKTVGFKGRGGTSHRYVFNKIEKMFENNLDELSLIISLTDNYSDIESIYNKYKFWKVIPYIILTNGAILSNLPKEIKQIKIGG